MWTRFMDMHSGGGTKVEDFEYIYIEAPRDEAIRIFVEKFDRHPENETCDCCGQDFSIYEEGDSLEEASEFERGTQSLAEWIARADVRVVRAAEIDESHR